MSNILDNEVLDILSGIYSRYILGCRVSSCSVVLIAEKNHYRVGETCLFQSEDTSLNLEYWDNYLDINYPNASNSFDIGFQKEGYMLHPQLGEIYVKPNKLRKSLFSTSIFTAATKQEIWIKSSRVSSDPSVSELGWMNFNRDNILPHWAFNPSYITNANVLGSYQQDLGVFMFLEKTNKYHSFIANSGGQIFISNGLSNLGDDVGSVTYYSVN
ncbi:MAG: hypothetical protein EBY39_12790 [Flavobacteriia bacterium]|nr:hypothetical protein [Flavobacteriia bacterium]